MHDDNLELTHGGGNVFADLGYANADVHQAKAILAAEIIKAMDAAGLSVRKAHTRTGIAAADFSRIRNGDLRLLSELSVQSPHAFSAPRAIAQRTDT